VALSQAVPTVWPKGYYAASAWEIAVTATLENYAAAGRIVADAHHAGTVDLNLDERAIIRSINAQSTELDSNRLAWKTTGYTGVINISYRSITGDIPVRVVRVN
jgi:hypothetical protein